MKKMYAFLVVLATAMTMNLNARTIYLNPNIWDIDNPVYAVHVWNTGDEDAGDAWFEPVAGAEGIFSAEIRDDATNAIFLRKNPNDEEVMTNIWGGWWNRAYSAIPSDKDLFTVTAWEGGEGDNPCIGTWSNYGAAPVYNTYHIYVTNQTGWEQFYLYAWGDSEAFGGWPGAQGTEFEFQANENGPVALHLIFHNNVGEGMEGDARQLFDITEARDYNLVVTATGVSENASAITLTETKDNRAVKHIVNGQLVIVREGKTFNALGTEIK